MKHPNPLALFVGSMALAWMIGAGLLAPVRADDAPLTPASPAAEGAVTGPVTGPDSGAITGAEPANAAPADTPQKSADQAKDPAPAGTEGDVTQGARVFIKCKACHSVTAPDGTQIVRGGRVGPNLYGVVGRPAASLPGFRYGDGIKLMGQSGLVWSQALIAEYVKNPTAFIDSHGGAGLSKMAFRLPEGGGDVAAYLASLK